jgi:hypothetical protein
LPHHLHISDFVQTQNKAKILTMTVGWFFSPLWKGMLSLLIHRSSVSSSGCLCSRFLPAHRMRYFFLLLLMISENFSLFSLRVRSMPLPSGSVPCLPCTACLPRYPDVYAICLPLPFCLCKHILGVMLEARDETNTSLPFGSLLTQIILQSAISVAGESKMKVQNPISK